MNIQHGIEATRSIATQSASALLTQQVGDETLIYNEQTHQAFCLNPVSAEVWRRMHDVQAPARIAAACSLALGAPVTEEAVLFALAELRENGLIDPETPAKPAPTRRDLMRQMGAGAIVMLPAVAAIMAPKAAQAYNGNVSGAVPARPGTPATFSTEPAKRSNTGGIGFYEPGDPAGPQDDSKKRRQDGEIFVP